MIQTIATVPYKNYIIKIYPDELFEAPNKWNDPECFLVGYHRDFCVEKNEIITKEQAISIFTGEISEKEILDKYYCFRLEAYIHSGVWLAFSEEGNFPDRRWDVSQIGLVLVNKYIQGKRAITKDTAKKYAKDLIDTWNDYLSGNVYGFEITAENGKEVDSCWGFYGDWEKNCLKEAQSVVDHL